MIHVIYELYYCEGKKMDRKNIKLIRDQLDTTIKRFKAIRSLNPPQKGWIRAVRDALGMNGRQFARRLGVNPSRVTEMEQGEVTGSLTLKSMRKAAEALDCVIVYGLVPRDSLESIVKAQVSKVARERFDRTSHTMALEDQALSSKEKRKALKELEDGLIRNMPKYLWDE